ncbi:DUF3592 domain-containing protein [Streptomyces sp. NPDC048288]|uniref:DUF3592 domain-containing protein n=1 Tax=Streptomyces sp. NPDC048288 TaxID=3365529 RepID=UPI00372293DD
MTNDTGHGERIQAAWAGREIGVRYPRGRPHAYRFVHDLPQGGRGLGWPNLAVFLIYVGPVVFAAIDRSWPWAPIGAGGPWTAVTALYLPQVAPVVNRRLDAPTSRLPVQGRVIAVLADTGTDSEGFTSSSHPPVIAFTTHEGTAVTAYCPDGLPHHAKSYGRGVTIRCTPDDPAVLTTDL